MNLNQVRNFVAGDWSILPLTMPTLELFHVRMPPIEEQRRIVARLNAGLVALDDARRAARAQLTEIEQLPARLLAQAFDEA